MKKFLFILITLVLVAGPYAVRPVSVFAACTDAQVDGWLAQQKLTRNGENLRAAYQALNDCGTAPAAPQPPSLFSFILTLTVLVARVVPFLMALTVLAIVWGIFRYIASGDEEEKREEGKRFVVYGIVGLFIMVSIWGLVNLLKGSFNLTASPPAVPTLPAIPGA
jgi:hypothetical protein